MELLSIVSNLLPTLLLGVVMWRLNTRTQQKLESMRAEMREKEAAIESLRSGALAIMLSRKTALHERRIKAADQIWSSVILGRTLATAMAILGGIEKEKIDIFRCFWISTAKIFEDKDYGNRYEYMEAEPFAPLTLWVPVLAYNHIVVWFIQVITLLKNGQSDNTIETLEMDIVKDLFKKALPDDAETIEKEGRRCYSKCFEKLEKNILAELQNMLAGKKASEDDIKHAQETLAECTKAAEALQKQRLKAE